MGIEAETLAAKERAWSRREWDEAHAFIVKQTKEIEGLKELKADCDAEHPPEPWAAKMEADMTTLRESLEQARTLLVETKRRMRHGGIATPCSGPCAEWLEGTMACTCGLDDLLKRIAVAIQPTEENDK